MEQQESNDCDKQISGKRTTSDDIQERESDSKRSRSHTDNYDHESDSDDDSESSVKASRSGSAGGAAAVRKYSTASRSNHSDSATGSTGIDRLRKEKRLAMNRESARLRRKRKKILIQCLESQVDELTTKVKEFQTTNERLTTRLGEVESELKIAHSKLLQYLSARTSPIQLQQPSAAGTGGINMNQLRNANSGMVALGGQRSSSLFGNSAIGKESPTAPVRGVAVATGSSRNDNFNDLLLQAQVASLLPPTPTPTSQRLLDRASLNDELIRQVLDNNTNTIRGDFRGSTFPITGAEQLHSFGGVPSVANRAGIHAETFDNVIARNQLFDNESIRRLSTGNFSRMAPTGTTSAFASGNEYIHRYSQQQSGNAQTQTELRLLQVQDLLAQQRQRTKVGGFQSGSTSTSRADCTGNRNNTSGSTGSNNAGTWYR